MNTDTLTYSFLKLREKLHRSAMKFLRDDEDARDALQDTFYRLWKSDPIESDAEARNKLFTVLKNICIDRLRKPQTISIKETDIDQRTVQPEYPEDQVQLNMLLMSGLSDIQKKIYRLVANEGIEYEEIASRLSMTVEAVRMNMSRARKKIRENYLKIDK
ncbi:MAG: sigma-70 family RNA polymerase sigma factor [Muribaculaceae bacterium]|nr:sigma-70 family RNA polymerase sigma factor [Muribaculaceae bacterium]